MRAAKNRMFQSHVAVITSIHAGAMLTHAGAVSPVAVADISITDLNNTKRGFAITIAIPFPIVMIFKLFLCPLIV
jgi:hypothetical protein